MLAAWTGDALSALAATASPPEKVVDWERYSGTWYVIAHLPGYFVDQCASPITSTYTPQADGQIEVRTHCVEANGRPSESSGTGDLIGPGHLRVEFKPGSLGYGPGLWAMDYIVLILDENYRWALVGSARKHQLWLLSRDKDLPQEVMTHLIEEAADRGYPTNKLVYPTHER